MEWFQCGVQAKCVALRTKPIKLATSHHSNYNAIFLSPALASHWQSKSVCELWVHAVLEVSLSMCWMANGQFIPHYATPIDEIMLNVDRINHEYWMHFVTRCRIKQLKARANLEKERVGNNNNTNKCKYLASNMQSLKWNMKSDSRRKKEKKWVSNKLACKLNSWSKSKSIQSIDMCSKCC